MINEEMYVNKCQASNCRKWSTIAMKRWVVLYMLTIPLLAFADSYWEGDAALQRGDTAFESGLYAASNSFAPDTQLLVSNLENGKSTVVTVSERADDQSDIMILLSPKAADAIGITAGSIARVRITVQQKAALGDASAVPESTSNPDSDINPAAAYAGTAGTPIAQQPTQPISAQPPAADQQPAAPPQTPQAQQPTTQEQPAATAQSTEDAEILGDAAARNPQKQLFLPPREDQKFAYKPATPAETVQAAPQPQTLAETPQVTPQPQIPVETPQVTPQPQIPVETPQAAPQPQTSAETPAVSGEAAGPSATQPGVPLAEAQTQMQPSPQEAGSPAVQPNQSEAAAQLALPQAGQGTAQAETNGAPLAQAGSEMIALSPPEAPPTQPTPSQAPAAPTAKPLQQAPPERQPGKAQVVSTLPRLSGKKKATTFYLQLGAYATQDVAQGLAGTLIQTYPVVVLAPSSAAKQIYRVLIGPLNKAESGTLLPLFKFKGFRDAFVRQE
jgi:cell division protein FtsN